MRAPLAAVLAALAAAAAAPARADWECTDGWGGHYRLAQAVHSGLLDCRPADAPSARADAADAARAALGDTRRQARAQAGGDDGAERPGLAPVEDAVMVPGRGRIGLLQLLELAPRDGPGLRLDGASPRRIGPAAADPALAALIDRSARQYGHDARLLHAIIRVESGFNPNAVSPKGAIGLMQVMPATAESLGLRDARRALFDPGTNVDVGARYLRRLRDLFPGRTDLAVAAYNAGEWAVLKSGSRVPPYPETQAYVRDVMALYAGGR